MQLANEADQLAMHSANAAFAATYALSERKEASSLRTLMLTGTRLSLD
jgi:hypothetical protein